MSASKDTLPHVIARATPANEPMSVDGVRRSLTATLRGQQWVAVSDGAGTPAEVVPDVARFGGQDGNALLTASVLCSREGPLSKVDVPDSPELEDRSALLTAAVVYGFDEVEGRPTSVTCSVTELQASQSLALHVASFRYGYGGDDGWRAMRSASSEVIGSRASGGAQLVAQPGHWSVTYAAEENTAAFVMRGAPADEDARLVCTSISARLVDPTGAQTGVRRVILADDNGELWTAYLMTKADGADQTGQACDRLELTGLNIVGAPGSPLYLEFDDAGGAGTFQSLAMAGYTTGEHARPVLSGYMTLEVGESVLQPGELAGYSALPADAFGTLIASDLGDYSAFRFTCGLPAMGQAWMSLELEGQGEAPPEDLQGMLTVKDENHNVLLGPLPLSSADQVGEDGNRRQWDWFDVGVYFLDGRIGQEVFVEFTPS